MKRQDLNKDAHSKIQMTVTLPKFLLEELERKAKKQQVRTSKIIEFLLQRHVMDEESFYTTMARYHCGKMNEYLFLKEQLLAINEVSK